MSRKQAYTPAQMEVIRFENDDVIISSCVGYDISGPGAFGCNSDGGGSGGCGIKVLGFGQTC